MSDCEFEKRPDGVGLITMNRPDTLNAMGGELMSLLGSHLDECERDREIRCVALTGAGRGFCAGGDVKGMAAPGGQAKPKSFTRDLEDRTHRLLTTMERTAGRLFSMPKPTVALVNGAAAGAGMSLALACDIRICSDKAKFHTAFGKIGFSGDYGGSWLLQRLVGRGRALELYYLGDPVDAARAEQLGLANHVVPHDELIDFGLEFCARLARGPTAALGRMKENFNTGAASAFSELMKLEARNHSISGMAPDLAEGVRSFVEKRPPKFTGE